MIEYDILYRRAGVRRDSDLASPVITSMAKWEFPFDSTLNYPSQSVIETGPQMDDPIFKNVTKVINIDHITDLRSSDGNPRRQVVAVQTMIRDFQQKNRRTRLFRGFDSVDRDRANLVVVNYAMLPHLYYYYKNYFAQYHAWRNIHYTIWSRMKEMANQTNRHQFLFISLPELLPDFATFTALNQKTTLNKDSLDVLGEGSFTIFDIWQWLGEETERSVLHGLDLKEEELRKINLVFTDNGNFFMINMGLLHSWRKITTEEKRVLLEAGEEVKSGNLSSSTIQRHLYRAMLRLVSLRMTALPSEEKAVVVEDKPLKKEQERIEEDLVADDEADDNGGKGLPTKPKTVEEEPTVPVIESEEPETHSEKKERLDEINRVTELTEEEDARELTELSTHVKVETPAEHLEARTHHLDNYEDGVKLLAEELADQNRLTAKEYLRVTDMASRYKMLPDPYGTGATLEEALKIKPEDTIIPEKNSIVGDVKGVSDPSMLNSSLELFDPTYIENVMSKDILNVVMSIQNAGVVVKDYSIETVEDVNDYHQVHTIKVVPVVGSPSTLRFTVPVIKADGTFKANGVKYRLRKQRADKPIRKVSPDRVALTSYYSKVFVYRSDRKVNNYPMWLVNTIVRLDTDTTNTTISDVKYSNVFQHELMVPRVYSTIAHRISSFKAEGVVWHWNILEGQKVFGEDVFNAFVTKKMFPVAKKGKGLFVMDMEDSIYFTADGTVDTIQYHGTIETVLGVDPQTKPIETVEVAVFGKAIPIGIILAKELGLKGLIQKLKTKVRYVRMTERLSLSEHEFAVRFADQSVVFDSTDRMAQFIFGSFNRYHNDLRRFPISEFEKRDVYNAILERNKMPPRFGRELDLMQKMFVDHITKELLIEMKEPTNFLDLLIRSAELLLNDQHPAAMDMRYMRDRGYERVPGMIYGELVRSIRLYKSRPVTANADVNLNPLAVWMTIMQDPAGRPIEELNPIHNLKEKEVVIFGGVGGRSSRSMTESNRTYHRSQMGVTSEATVDNSDVATITYLTADPGYRSVRGTTRQMKAGDGPTRIVSTSMLTSPGADRDDPKRVNFISVQNSQTAASIGYTPTPIRTGYERMLAHRTDDLFAATAKKDGVVKSIDGDHVLIEHKDGTTRIVELGRRYGDNAGSTIPHMVLSDLKEGQKVKVGDVLAFNKDFFVRDTLDPSQVLWKPGAIATVAFMETPGTYEDSCEISEAFAERLTSKTTSVKTIRVRFDQEIRDLVAVNEQVGLETILCTIEDQFEGNNDLFDEDALASLKHLSSHTPRAKVKGVVERIEVLYRGHIDDMSKSLRSLSVASDNRRSKLNQKMGKKVIKGSVDESYRIEGKSLEMDMAAIQIYMTGDTAAGYADKIVLGNQMKSTIGRVMSGRNETKDGEPVDLIFGFKSINNRIVNSPMIIGTTNAILIHIGKKAVEAYRSK